MQKHRKRAFILRGTKTHKRLIINPIVKRFCVKKTKNTEGVLFIEFIRKINNPF
jgi:hypothetical protein